MPLTLTKCRCGWSSLAPADISIVIHGARAGNFEPLDLRSRRDWGQSLGSGFSHYPHAATEAAEASSSHMRHLPPPSHLAVSSHVDGANYGKSPLPASPSSFHVSFILGTSLPAKCTPPSSMSPQARRHSRSVDRASALVLLTSKARTTARSHCPPRLLPFTCPLF